MSNEKYYKQKEKARELFTIGYLQPFDSTLITDDYPDEWMDHWTFDCAWEYVEDRREYDYDETEFELATCNIPMWDTWFQLEGSLYDFVYRHMVEVADLGLVIIYHDEVLWGLGVDGAGYDFYEHHWIPLAKLYGWIEEDEDDE